MVRDRYGDVKKIEKHEAVTVDLIFSDLDLPKSREDRLSLGVLLTPLMRNGGDTLINPLFYALELDIVYF